MVPFQQVPVFKENTDIKISKEDFMALMHANEVLMDIMSNLFNRLIAEGVLSMQYQDDFGNPLTEDQVRDMINAYNENTQELIKSPN